MSFLLDPSSPSSTSANTTTSSPDSLAFPPGIAETNPTTVDDASKSRILIPASPSEAGPSGLVPSPRDTTAATDVESDTPVDEDAPAATDPDAWHYRVQAPHSRAQSDVTSPATTIQTPIATAHRGPARFSLADPQIVTERSPTASSQSSESSVQQSPSRSSYSESESGSSSVESSSTSGDESASSSSSSTERSRWQQTDLGVRSARAAGKLRAGIAADVGSRSGRALSDEARRSAVSPPRVRMSESLLFSHSLPPQAKWKGKERERDPELEPRKERAREKAPQQQHRRRSSGATSLSKIRTTRGDTVIKYQEPGFSRDFLLLVALCVGLACGFILVVRPAMLSLLGHPGSVSFSLTDLD